MKNKIVLLCGVLCILFLFNGCNNSADSKKSGTVETEKDSYIAHYSTEESECGWTYDEYTRHIEISLYNMPYDQNGILEIPAKINGKPVTHIKDCNYDYTKYKYYVEKLVLPDALTYIGKDAFFELSPLNEVVIPDGLKEVGHGAFSKFHEWYKNLSDEYVIVGDGVLIKYNGEHPDSYTRDDINSEDPENSITIPEGVKYIGGSVFANMYITSVTLPSTLEIIGDSAFYGNFTLKSITIPGNVERISYQAFRECDLNDVVFNEGLKIIEGFAFFDNKLKEVTLPKSLEGCSSGAFTCYIDDPPTITIFGSPAYFDFYGLEDATIRLPEGSKFAEKLEKNGIAYETFKE